MIRRALLSFGLLATVGVPAAAQDITLDPATPPAIEKAPPPPPPNQVIINNPGGNAEEQAAQPEGVYYDDGSTAAPESDQTLDDGAGYTGIVPEVHVVKTGDTLWDICAYYYANPWEWPKLWAKNPNITNPHWIYPGNVVRLAPGGSAVASAAPVSGDDGSAGTLTIRSAKVGGRGRVIDLRQTSFVDDEAMKFAGKIIGSEEEKVMLATGDIVYLEYPEGKPPQLNQRYAVYTDAKYIKHPETKKVVGAYVTLRGEVRILEVKKGRKASAVITYITDTIERGMRVGPGKTQFKDVAPTKPERDLEGVVIGMLGTDQILGDRQVVFVDRGSDDGLRLGNTLRVLRRGDAYRKIQSAGSNAGMDDRKFPDIDLGEIIVVDVAKKSAIGYVSIATQEIEIGDHVLMRQSR